MNRRHAVGCAALCLPAGLLAQPALRNARVGLLVGSVPPQDGGLWPTQQALLQRLRELGWAEASNLRVVLRYGHGTSEGMARAASEIAALGPDVIVAAGTQPVRALQRATMTIPIVMAGTGDPVGSGLVASLSRPGGHTTGVSLMGQEVIPKTMSLLREAVPRARRIDLLSSAANPASPFFARILADAVVALGIEGQAVELHVRSFMPQYEAAAHRLGVSLVKVALPRPDDLGAAFEAIVRAGAMAVGFGAQPWQQSRGPRLAALCLKHRLPATTIFDDVARDGVMMAYGWRVVDLMRRVPGFIDRILRQAVAPGELPVEQPTHFYLTLNLKTASALGVSVPPSLRLRADEVIE